MTGPLLATLAHLLAGLCFLTCIILSKFALERALVLDFCKELQAVSCSDSEVSAAAASWVRWVFLSQTSIALFMLPIAGATSDFLKVSAPAAVDARIPLMILQLAALAIVPATYLLQSLLGLPRWVQLVGSIISSTAGGQINVMMPTWYAVRADLFLAEPLRPTCSHEPMKTGGDDDGSSTDGSGKGEHVSKGAAFFRMELVLLLGVVIAGRLETLALDASPGNELVALQILFLVSFLCACAGALSIAMSGLAANAYLARHGLVPVKTVHLHQNRPQLSGVLDKSLASRSLEHVVDTIRSAARKATAPQIRFAVLLMLVFSISNSTEGMSNILVIYLGGFGFDASELALGVQLGGVCQIGVLSCALCLLPCVGSVEFFIIGFAALSSAGWGILASGVVLQAKAMMFAHYTLSGMWGMTIVMTRSLVVLYVPQQSLGTALATLGMMDEFVTSLGDYTYSTLLAVTIESSPAAPAALATLMMALCCVCAIGMTLASPYWQETKGKASSELI